MITNLDIDSILNRGEPRDYRSSQRDCCVTERDWSYIKNRADHLDYFLVGA
jgi:hypothetical protein